MLEHTIGTEKEFKQWESEDYEVVENIRRVAWDAYLRLILEERVQVMDMLDEIAPGSTHVSELAEVRDRPSALP